MTPPVFTDVTEYQVSCLPAGHPERHHFTLSVARRNPTVEAGWAVADRMGSCANRRGVWSYESLPSSRTDRWKNAHRFTLEEALKLAERLAPKITLGKFIVDDFLEGDDPWVAMRKRTGAPEPETSSEEA